MLKIDLINDQATLNNFSILPNKEYVAGYPLVIKFRISDSDTKLRLIPSTVATCTCTFQKSDGTELVKTGTMLFNPDDRSLWSISLTTQDTLDVVGTNMLVKLDMLGDTTDIRIGMASNVLSKITFDGEC